MTLWMTPQQETITNLTLVSPPPGIQKKGAEFVEFPK